MAAPKAKLQKLIETRDALCREQEAIKNKILGIEMAITVLDATDDEPSHAPVRARRGNVKSALLDLLKEAGASGINATAAVEIASRRGVDLDRGTVSSLLSRFKADGITTYDGERYRLKDAGATQPQGDREPHRAH